MDAGIGIPKVWREQAKAMEKEQIQQSFNDGVKNSDDYVVIDGNVINAEIYYNKTFGI